MKSSQSLGTPQLVGTVGITAVLLIGFYFLILNNGPESASTESPVTTVSTSPAPTVAVASPAAGEATSMAYKDGVYSASADYQVPRDSNTINVKVTLKDDIIQAVETDFNYEDEKSVPYVNGFKSGISGLVVGKKIDDVEVSRVNGSSLTSAGFNAALNAIATQAKS